MEMELDKSEIQQINDELNNGQQPVENKFCTECNQYHSETFSGHQFDEGSEDINDFAEGEEMEEEEEEETLEEDHEEESQEEEYFSGDQEEIVDEEQEEDFNAYDQQAQMGQQPAGFNPQTQFEKIQKMREDVQRQLELCLTDMLVNLYNSKEQSVYEGLYIKVIQKLHW